MESVTPHQNDVLFGRGRAINEHAGNKIYRTIIASHKSDYSKLNVSQRQEKRNIAIKIVNEIKTNLGGRFLEIATSDQIKSLTTSAVDARSETINNKQVVANNSQEVHWAVLNKVWVHVEEGKVVEKVLHSLREKIKRRDSGGDSENGKEGVPTDDGRYPSNVPISDNNKSTLNNNSMNEGQQKDNESNVLEGGIDIHSFGSIDSTSGAFSFDPNLEGGEEKDGQWNALVQSLCEGESTSFSIGSDLGVTGQSDSTQPWTIPNRYDVLLGRGRSIHDHPGNQYFRSFVDKHKAEFRAASKRIEKQRITSNIVAEISNLGRRFLMEDKAYPSANHKFTKQKETQDIAMNGGGEESRAVDPKILDKVWKYADRERVIDKVMHRLREKDLAVGADEVQQGAAKQKKKIEGRTKSNSNGASMSLTAASAVARRISPVDAEKQLGNEYIIEHKSISNTANRGTIEDINSDSCGSIHSTFGTSSFDVPNLEGLKPQHGGDEEDDEWNAFMQSLCEEEGTRSAIGSDLDSMREQSTEDSIQQKVGGDSVDGDTLLSDTVLYNDDDIASFLRNVEAQKSVHNHEISLHEWIHQSAARSGSMLEYAKLALPIALRLTEYLVETEQVEGHSCNIPLSSIATKNVSIRAIESSYDGQEVFENVFIMSGVEDDPLVGDVMSRLAALGLVFYELFSAEEPLLVGNGNTSTFDPTTLDSIHLGDDLANSGTTPRPEKSQRQLLPKNVEDGIASYIETMESKGLPRSIRDLVRNLLDCQHGDFRQDDSYSAIADLQLDLHLMINDTRFVEDIQTNPLPTLKLGEFFSGRDEEVLKLEQLHQQHTNGKCSGVTITGEAGVGKSRLAMHCLQRLASQTSSYLLCAKFDQNKTQLKPLSTITGIFNSLCDVVVHDVSSDVLAAISTELAHALGSQAGSLVTLVPSLSRLLPLSVEAQTFDDCVDSAVSLRFLMGEVLRVISFHARPTIMLIDDVQWSDAASLLLIGNLIHTARSSNVFFTLCYRDDKLGNTDTFDAWLESLSMFKFETIVVKGLNVAAVNGLLSHALQLSPRLTMALASVLHHKTAGNPLFLCQLIASLAEQQHIYFSLNSLRWMWDLNKIQDMKVSDDVVALLTKEMQMLSSELLLGLTVAACFGSTINYKTLNILANDLNIDLIGALKNVSQKGFMVDSTDDFTFRFSHDKIEQSVYCLMSDEQRQKNHSQYGLALCFNYLSTNDDGNDEMLFIAVNQVNRGGPGMMDGNAPKSIVASLNLRAGKRAQDLSDFESAIEYFRHGIFFLPQAHWQLEYKLSLELFDAAAESACALNKIDLVTSYTDQVIANATCLDDKLSCLYVTIEALRRAEKWRESMEASFTILSQLGEVIPTALDNVKLSEMKSSVDIMLQSTTDDTILSMQQIKMGRFVILQKVYSNLAYILQFMRPSLIHYVALRMMELMVQIGLCSVSPLAFAIYGSILATGGYLEKGSRLGRLALKLCEKTHCSRHRAQVYVLVYQGILWVSTPLQSIAEAHSLGWKYGQQSGDVVYSMLNLSFEIQTSIVAGFPLLNVRERTRKQTEELENKKVKVFHWACYSWIIQIGVLREGLHVATQSKVDGFPGEQEVMARDDVQEPIAQLFIGILQIMRAVLFGQLKEMSIHANITDMISKHDHIIRPLFVIGMFYEGLASFQLARETNEKEKWTKCGESVLSKMKIWAQQSFWNWDNKRLLLEAESMYCAGDFDGAALSYIRAIELASKHKFIHEEALTSELAGLFYYERDKAKSYQLLQHSVKCYTKWGSLAVAKRVENLISSRFGSATVPYQPEKVIVLDGGGPSNHKRHGMG